MQPNLEDKVELPLILASGVLVLAWLVSYLALLQTNQESRGIEECCNQNKLTKLGRCDSYTIDWLLIKLPDCWDCKTARTLRNTRNSSPELSGLLGVAGLRGLEVCEGLAGINRIGRIGKIGKNGRKVLWHPPDTPQQPSDSPRHPPDILQTTAKTHPNTPATMADKDGNRGRC